ncbi:MAG: transcriptional repressor [Clostridia bacterium]|nr:transcriptional repressor [Clostridia bacterium]
MRYSKQREMILQAVKANKIHPTADQVYKLVRAESPTISLGTVYRDLNQLVEAKEILRIAISGDKDRFDADTSVHYHVKCLHCGHFKDLPKALTQNFSSLLIQVSEDMGMTLSPTCMQFEGLCEACKQEKMKKSEA